MNSYVQVYKKYLADTGKKDDRTDYEIVEDLGNLAKERDPSLFDKYPDFARDWASIREANAPSLGEETGRAFKRAGIGLGATALGGLSLATGSDYLKRKSRALDLMASDPDLAPTVGSLEDIAPGQTGSDKLLSRDTVRYGLSKVGEAVPSIGEAVATGLIGATAGSSVAPGPGTVAGGLTGLFAKSVIKKAIKNLVTKELREEMIEEALKKGVPEIVEAVTKNARAISAARGGTAAAAVNSYALNAGEIYNETDDRGLAAGLGALSAIPDTVLPAIIVRKLFPGVTLGAGQEAAKKLVGDRAIKLAEAAGITGLEAGTEGFQQAVNIVARNLKDGRDAMTFTDDDIKEMREASIGGAFGGGIAAGPLSLMGGRQAVDTAPKPVEEAAPITPAPVVVEEIAAPVVVSPTRRVMAMSPEQQAGRVVELESRPMVGDEQQEYQLLKQVAPAALAPTTLIPNEIEQPIIPAIPPDEAVVGQPPTVAPAPVQYLYTIQRPQQSGEQIIPGYIQIDSVQDGKNVESTSLEKLSAQGINLPQPPESLPQGQYTLEQVQQAIVSEAPPPVVAGTVPDIAPPQVPAPVQPMAFDEAPPVIAADAPVEDVAIPESAPPQLTEEAVNLVAKVDSGGAAPAFISRNLEKIATDNGVVVTGQMRPMDVVDALRQKGQASAVSASIPPVSGPVIDSAPRTAEQRLNNAGLDLPPISSMSREAKRAELDAAGITTYNGKPLDQANPAQISNAVGKLRRGELSADGSPAMRTTTEPSNPAVQATRTKQFQTVMARMVENGANVQVMSQELLAQQTGDMLRQQVAMLGQQLAQATTAPQRDEITRQLNFRKERLTEVDEMRGVTYSPYHIAIAMKDVMSANVHELVTLLHEAAESLTMRLTPGQQGATMRAVEAMATDMHARMNAAAQNTGATIAHVPNPSELLAESMAQKLAAEGVPEAKSLADAIVRWVKEIYYRVSMAAQKAFGGEPNPEIAIAWYENQLRRELGGDYSYSMESLLDRLMPMSNERIARKFTNLTGTPDGLVDFYDSVSEKTQQPLAEPISGEALDWNMKFQTGSNSPTQENAIPAEEAYARTAAAAYSDQIAWMEEVRAKVAPDMNPQEFYSIFGYGESSPQELLAALETKYPGISEAKIGGERMTDVMNKNASYQVLQFIRGMQAKHLNSVSKMEDAVKNAEESYTEHANELNRLEPDVRNAEVHEGILRRKVRTMLTDLLKSYKDGIKVSSKIGGMMRTEEGLGEFDPMPKYYEQVFNSLLNGDINLFEYVDAIAALDLPLSTMNPNEVLKSIRDNAETSPKLGELARNKPLALTLATLASDSARQFDQVQLRKAEGSRFLEIRKDLEAIRNATEAQLREMIKGIDEKNAAKGLRQRIQHEYMLERRALRRASDRMKEADARIKLLTDAKKAVDDKVADSEQAIGGIYTDWRPVAGADFTVMKRKDDGSYSRSLRRLEFNQDGSAVDSTGILNDLAQNQQWLKANKDKEGQKEYNKIKHETQTLQALDVQRAYQAANFGKVMGFIDSFVRPLQAIAKQAGGAGSRIVQEFNQYEFINRSGEKSLKPGAYQWNFAMNQVMKSAGIKDVGQFRAQVYNPVMYYLGVNPGLDQGQAIREATREARKRLAKEPAADFNEKFEKFLRETKSVNEEMLKTAEQYGVMVSDPKLQGELRRALAQGWITGMRGMNDGLVVTLINDMQKAGWNMEYDWTGKKRRATYSTTFQNLIPPELNKDGSNAQDRADYMAQLDNTEVLRAALKPYFTPRVLNGWLLPFINKAGKTVFTHNGQNISQLDLQSAWATANGDVLQWIDNLGQRLEIEGQEGESDVATFRADMLKQIEDLYAWEARMAYESQKTPDLFNEHGTKLHVMMDARMNDTLPPEHVNFAMYDPTSVQQLLGQIAFHGAFGRNGQALGANLVELSDTLKLKKAQFDSLQSSTVSGRQAEAKQRGWDYNDLERGVKHWQDVEELRGEIESAFGLNNTYGPLHDARAGLEMLGFVVGQAVDQPKTAALNFLSLGARPFAMHSLGPKAIKATAASYAELAKNSFGGMLKDFGIDLIKMSDYAKEAGEVEGKAFRRLPYGVAMSDLGKEGSFQDGLAQRFVVHPLRILKAIQKKGVGPGLLSIPGLGTMQRFATEGAIANLRGQTYLLEGIINAGIKHFSANPQDLNNPAFRFDADKLKMRMDRGVYDWFRNKTVEYNMGPIENIVREATGRMKTGERIITKEMVEQLTQMNAQELDGASSINTAPAGLANNPALRVAMPLLRWPLWMMHAAHEGLADANGKADFKSAMRGIGRLAAWNLPLGLAFTFMVDEYDEEILGKKNAMPETSKWAGVPIIGLPLALATTDRSIPREAINIAQRMIRSGNVYGLGADFAGAFITPFDPGSGQRAFSLDQRVMVMSQLLNMSQAISNMVSQGGTATWGSVYRPMVASIGGNGMLNTIGIANNMLGLDNQEARLTMRINAARWVNTAAKEIGIETKKVSGYSNPSEMSVWTREMQLAAMANDRKGFGDAYQRALQAARETVNQDERVSPDKRENEALQRVLASWKSRNPFSGLASTPTSDQIAQLLGAMDEDGRRDVSDAMRQYQSYTALISPSASDKTYARRLNTLRAQANPVQAMERLRRQAVVGMLAYP